MMQGEARRHGGISIQHRVAEALGSPGSVLGALLLSVAGCDGDGRPSSWSGDTQPSACEGSPHDLGATPRGARHGKTNVVVLLADDMGYQGLSAQGSPDIRTPHIDSIAAEGVRFTDGYATAPQCSPSRAGLLTGRYQQRFGHESNPDREYHDVFGLSAAEPTLGDYLRAEGYHTGAVGKWHLGNNPDVAHPLTRGFDEWYGFLGGGRRYEPAGDDKDFTGRLTTSQTEVVEETRYLTEELTCGAVEFIERNAAAPFALYVAYHAPHSPFEPPKEYLARNEHIDDPNRRALAAMTTALDDGVGEILETLDRLDLEDDTLVVFLSDNGATSSEPFALASNGELRGAKGDLYEGGIRVPFLMKWPASGIAPGSEYHGPVSALDIIPTALAAAGGEPPSQLDGEDLLSRVTAPDHESAERALFWRFMGHKAIRVGNWKWVVDRKTNEEQLFDLADDAVETQNLAAEYPDRVEELRERWRAWNRELVAPLWRPESERELLLDRYYDEGMGTLP